jgi:hypothetical protein
MKLIVDINREGITNEEIKKVRGFLSELTSRDFKTLCDGNKISVSVGVNPPLKVTYKIEE